MTRDIKSYLFRSVFIASLILIIIGLTGCTYYMSVYKLPFGEKSLRGKYVSVYRDEIWNMEEGTPVTFDDMIDTLTDRTVVYVGELHDNTDHHRLQLDIIKALYSSNPELIIGMEMFPASTQHILDRWTRGELTEDAFLDEVQWYYRWDLPYDYYKDILDFAKEKEITLAALNIPEGILIKVLSEGLDALTEGEQKMLPTIIPVTKEYKDYLKTNYRVHPGAHTPSLEDFITTQDLWDSTMAENILLSIDRKTFDNPQVVVITGGGHIIYGVGIPDRVYRRSKLSYAIVLPIGLMEDETREMARSVGTFVVGTKPSPPLPHLPRLGITFKPNKENGKGLRIIAVAKDSIAEKAGIKVDDLIISFNGVEIKTSHTLTRLLRTGVWDKTVDIEIQRGANVVTVKATFPPYPSITKEHPLSLLPSPLPSLIV